MNETGHDRITHREHQLLLTQHLSDSDKTMPNPVKVLNQEWWENIVIGMSMNRNWYDWYILVYELVYFHNV